MLNGINHLTLAVTDLDKSISFYQSLLGMKLHASWKKGAYISCGDLWLCLSLDTTRHFLSPEKTDYTHYAFNVDAKDFLIVVDRLMQANVIVWKENKSEGDSFYFLDPDGHKLELHVGGLLQRLKSCQENPYEEMKFY
ncbi:MULTISPECIES: fosfomycin resistance glutathione transferase [Providencia]|uniref:fosfomycin resistance glutathione transferase n=1 Tax=Providencia TaxID=586 RepID=UPI0018E493FA|nr:MULTISPECIES: fosfomycin resistance glutathione transferase [Providencia]EJF7711297.1 fosfomycin resistance glutathione transferase [Providencia rettgeri]EJF7713814.1 fosfomycin resistance glutathione transferase [Providencia rettgeri]ELR5115842.1 fosfomycin resistance glutathione transferase [Providencia rettgeri]ELR5119264.1 fosfomycin resistance glutathione transferase [Providencia rettgeri]MBI6201004.1 fosfomycin resistance glutathione transferase [Providencia rettgeri]